MKGLDANVPVGPEAFAPDTDAQHDDIIKPVVAILRECGVPPNVLTDQNALHKGMSKRIFAALMRPLTAYDTAEKLERVLLLGIAKRFFSTIRSINLTTLDKFVRFLKTANGQRALASIAFQEKISRRSKGRFTVAQVCAAQLLDIQTSDRASRLKRVREEYGAQIALREEYGAQIAEAEMKVKQLRTELDTALASIHDEFMPASAYVPMGEAELNLACWRHYCDKCIEERVTAAPLTEANMITATLTFMVDVNQSHRIAFVSEGDRSDALQAFGKEKIAEFRGLLGGMGVDETDYDADGTGG